jgi:hypothetical protein
MVARILPRNTKQEVEEFTTKHETGSQGAKLSSLNRRTLMFESESRVCAASLCRAPTVLLHQRTGQIEQPYDTRTIDLSCTEKGFCPLESGTSKPHGVSACAKHRYGRAQHAGSQHRSHIHTTSITHPQTGPQAQSPRPHCKIARRQAWPLARCQHDSESMASMAAARRQVGKREKSIFGIERAQSPAEYEAR